MIASLYQRGSVALAIFFTLLLSVQLQCALSPGAVSFYAVYAENLRGRLNTFLQRFAKNIRGIWPRIWLDKFIYRRSRADWGSLPVKLREHLRCCAVLRGPGPGTPSR